MDTFIKYVEDYNRLVSNFDWSPVLLLAKVLLETWQKDKTVFICGNGGSCANAEHLANDYLYAVASKGAGKGMRIQALTSNSSLVTCLGNDIEYENIFSKQVEVFGSEGDILIILSGSGNSANVVNAIEAAKTKQMITTGILGYSGGKSKELLDIAIHLPSNDMQKCEDFQLMVGHMLMQWLEKRDPYKKIQ